MPGEAGTVLDVVDMHTAGEPVRIIVGGYPQFQGASILDKRREARERHDHLRRALMLEPRGHAGMYGVILVEPSQPGCAAAALFTHVEGYSTMCGHATVALGRFLIESGRIAAQEPVTRFAVELPCGVVELACRIEGGRVTSSAFASVPAFLAQPELAVAVPGLGTVALDIAYGGAFYALLPSSQVGRDFFATPIADLVEIAGAITAAVRAGVRIEHPQEPDLSFLYGTILTDDAAGAAPTHNLCVFADRQVDRSPTGSGVTARLARDRARGLIGEGVLRRFFGPSGLPFDGRVLGPAVAAIPGAVRVEVSGTSSFTGTARFSMEPDDPLGHGFALPSRFGDLASAP
jgi:trans-L-3-hydroxyproline dehydratase